MCVAGSEFETNIEVSASVVMSGVVLDDVLESSTDVVLTSIVVTLGLIVADGTDVEVWDSVVEGVFEVVEGGP